MAWKHLVIDRHTYGRFCLMIQNFLITLINSKEKKKKKKKKKKKNNKKYKKKKKNIKIENFQIT